MTGMQVFSSGNSTELGICWEQTPPVIQKVLLGSSEAVESKSFTLESGNTWGNRAGI